MTLLWIGRCGSSQQANQKGSLSLSLSFCFSYLLPATERLIADQFESDIIHHSSIYATWLAHERRMGGTIKGQLIVNYYTNCSIFHIKHFYFYAYGT